MTVAGSGRSLAVRLAIWLRNARYTPKWLVLGVLIGIVAGLGAVVFTFFLDVATRLLIVDLGGYTPAGTVGDGGPAHASDFSRPWAIPLVVAAGGLAAGILVFGFAPEAEGHGTDAAIEAVQKHPKGVRARVTVIKTLASALTIGSGGSGGREGPTAQISASFGSILARKLNLTPEDSRLAVATGIGSGIGAIFRTPLGGAVLGAEILYRDDIEADALIPSVIASVTGYGIFGAITGNFGPIFGYNSDALLVGAGQVAMIALVGVACGLLGRLYITTFYGLTNFFHRTPLPRMARPALAGLAVGALGLLVPGVLGTGYGVLQETLNQADLLDMALWAVLALPFVKILATSLTIGSGGSAGVFGPGMVVGGAAGAGIWRLFELAGVAPDSPAPFVIIGMTACFGAIAHSPLAVIIMVSEMTGNLTLLPAAMVAIAIATFIVGEQTIYKSQLVSRADVDWEALGEGPGTAGGQPGEQPGEQPETPGIRVEALGDRLAYTARIESVTMTPDDWGLRGGPEVAWASRELNAALREAVNEPGSTRDSVRTRMDAVLARMVDPRDNPEPGAALGRMLDLLFGAGKARP